MPKEYKYYMVFVGQTTNRVGGDPRSGEVTQWNSGPIGVFRAENPEEACKAGARKVRLVANYFAMEGFPWGMNILDAPTDEFGSTYGPAELLVGNQ